jgi:hypothetical protein
MGKIKELSQKFEHTKAYDDDISDSKRKKTEHDEKIKAVITKFGDLPEDKKKLAKSSKVKVEKKAKEKPKEEKREEKKKEEREEKPQKREIRIKAASSEEKVKQQKPEQPVKITHPIKTGFFIGVGLLLFIVLLFILLYSVSLIVGMSVSELIYSLI